MVRGNQVGKTGMKLYIEKTKNIYDWDIYMVMKYQEYWIQEWNIYVQWFLWGIGKALWETLHTLSNEFYVLGNWAMCSLFIKNYRM